jgi:uncharacterized protein DUF2752
LTPFAGWLLTGIAASSGFVGLGLWDPGSDTAPPFCLVRRVLDFPCPGCGMTRALHALAHGDLAGAIAFHALAPVLAVEAVLVWVVWGLRMRGRSGYQPMAGAEVPGVIPPAASWLPLLYGNGAALVALWAGRLAAGSLPW